MKERIKFSSVQDRGFTLEKAHNGLQPVSLKFLQHCLWNSSFSRLVGDDPSQTGKSRKILSATSFCASLVQAVDAVTTLALSPRCLKFLNTSDFLRRKPLVMIALPACLSARSLPFTQACPGRGVHSSLRRESVKLQCSCKLFSCVVIILLLFLRLYSVL